MNLYSFLRGFSQCQRRIHSSTQMMSYIDFSKSRFFDFFLDWSPGSKNVPQACRDLPGRFATLPDPENRPKILKNAILFENYFFNSWRPFLFLTAFKDYTAYQHDAYLDWVWWASGASRSLRQALRSKNVPRGLCRKAKRAGGNQKEIGASRSISNQVS